MIESWPKATAGDNQFAREFDAALAQTKPTDLWYLQATKLRADWRIRSQDPTEREQLGVEAREAIDNAISLYQDLEFYGMRLAAAFLAEEPLDVIETARRMVWVMQDEIKRAAWAGWEIPPATIQRNTARVNSMAVGLRQLLDEGKIPEYKFQDVDVQMQLLLDEYQAMGKE